MFFSVHPVSYPNNFSNNMNNTTSFGSEAFKPVVVDEEYAEKVKALAQLLTKTKDELDMVKNLADSLKGGQDRKARFLWIWIRRLCNEGCA